MVPAEKFIKLMSVSLLLVMSSGQLNVNGAKQRKYKRLQNPNQQFQEIEWKRQKDGKNVREWRGQFVAKATHRVQKAFARKNISVKTQRK
jgi:hypothetical protein